MKYQPLRDYLASLPKSKQDATQRFAEIEKVIGARSPKSASYYAAWWGNQDYGVQAPAWNAAGFGSAVRARLKRSEAISSRKLLAKCFPTFENGIGGMMPQNDL